MDTIQNKKVFFKSIIDVTHYDKNGAWVYLNKDSSASCALFFNLINSNVNTLSVEYSPECWFYFSYQVVGQKIIVTWDNNIDTKYNFDIVKTVHKLDKKYLGKPFMILQLINDSTLQTTYTYPELIKKLNAVNNNRIMFPDKFYFIKSYM